MSDGTSPETNPVQSNQKTGGRMSWDATIIAIADVPWGLIIAVIALLLIGFGGKTGLGKAVPMLTAAGLFGIGHGIHTAAKVRHSK